LDFELHVLVASPLRPWIATILTGQRLVRNETNEETYSLDVGNFILGAIELMNSKCLLFALKVHFGGRTWLLLPARNRSWKRERFGAIYIAPSHFSAAKVSAARRPFRICCAAFVLLQSNGRPSVVMLLGAPTHGEGNGTIAYRELNLTLHPSAGANTKVNLCFSEPRAPPSSPSGNVMLVVA
jgi:hypothetical protein